MLHLLYRWFCVHISASSHVSIFITVLLYIYIKDDVSSTDKCTVFDVANIRIDEDKVQENNDILTFSYFLYLNALEIVFLFHECSQIANDSLKNILLFCREGDIYDDVDYKRGRFFF